MAADWLRRAGVLARRHPAAIAVTLALVSGLGAWVYSGVRAALVELAAANLRSLAASQALAVETWIGEKLLNVQRWTADPRVVEAAERLLAAGRRGDASLREACDGAVGTGLVQAIDALRLEDAAAAIYLLDRDGRVLAARDAGKCARRVAPALHAAILPSLQGRAQFAASRFEAERIGVPGAGDAPKVWISAPVRNAAGEVIAVLDIGKPADQRFAALFAAASIGASGESFAFDRRGVLLSESRFREALIERGMLRAGESGTLRQRLDDPEAVGEAQPTGLVAQALAGLGAEPPRLQGDRSEPYTTYYGERVVGAWRWLEPHGFGVAVEVSAAEAFAPLRRIEMAFLALGGAVGVVAFGFAVALLRMQRMAEQVEEAQRVGNYELLAQVGQGGMARVYRAQHRLLKRPTAVKIIELAHTSDEMLARFDREVRLASQLMHPNTVEVFDYGRTPEGQPFYAMEFLDGLTLQEVVERHGPLPAARAAHALRGIAGSLSEAHARGLVHRDIKPANVMLCRRGGEDDVVKVLDFGLVKDGLHGPRAHRTAGQRRCPLRPVRARRGGLLPARRQGALRRRLGPRAGLSGGAHAGAAGLGGGGRRGSGGARRPDRALPGQAARGSTRLGRRGGGRTGPAAGDDAVDQRAGAGLVGSERRRRAAGLASARDGRQRPTAWPAARRAARAARR